VYSTRFISYFQKNIKTKKQQLSFTKFGVKNFIVKKKQVKKKKTIMVEHYNLMDPVELGAITF
jgi:hypothetical protein